jgi:hypothetical protein
VPLVVPLLPPLLVPLLPPLLLLVPLLPPLLVPLLPPLLVVPLLPPLLVAHPPRGPEPGSSGTAESNSSTVVCTLCKGLSASEPPPKLIWTAVLKSQVPADRGWPWPSSVVVPIAAPDSE